MARFKHAGVRPPTTVGICATWAEPVVSGNRGFVKDVATLALWTVN